MGKTSQRHITTISGHLEAARTSLEALVTSIALWETRTSRDKLTAALKNPDTYAAFTKSLTPLWQRIESSHKTAKTELASAGTALTTFEGFINTKKANKSKLLPKFLTSIGSSEKFIAHAKGDLSALKTQVPAALPKRPIGV